MTKRAVRPIENETVRLRLLQEEDLPMTRRWRNQDHIRRCFFHSDVITPEQHVSWYQQYTERDDDFVFIIEDVQEFNRPIGQLSLYNIQWELSKAEFGRLMIGEVDASGKGLARAATSALIQYAFHSFKLDEIYLEVLATNVQAINLYKSVGFNTDSRSQHKVRMNIFRS